MKVIDFIDLLNQLDSNRDIWIVYDSYSAFVPIIDVIDNSNIPDVGQVGDYALFVG